MRLISFLLFVWLMLLVVPVFAGGDELTNVQELHTFQSNTVEGSESLGVGLAGGPGDVDISDRVCVGSVQGGGLTFFKQKLVPIEWCWAIYFDRIGQYETAAKIRCGMDGIRELFADDDSCESGTIVKVPIPDGTDAPGRSGSTEGEDEDEDDDEWREVVAALRNDFEDQKKKEVRTPQPRPVSVYNQIGLDAEQRADLGEIFGK